jgi:Flp pilus assembly protein TadD
MFRLRLSPRLLNISAKLGLVLALFLLPVCIFSQTSQSPAEFEQAQQHFSNKQYKEAAAASASIAEHTSDSSLRLAALKLEAKALINISDFLSAETVLNTWLASEPNSSDALYLLGYALERNNKPRESLATYTRAAALAPPQPNDLKLVALDYVLLDDYADAIQWLRRSLAADPTNAEAWYFMGRSHMQIGDFTQAEKDLHHSIELSPNDPKAFDNLGLALEAQTRNDEAEAAYKKAIDIQTRAPHESEQPLLNLGTLLNNENRSPEALPYLKHATELAPTNPRCQEELSRAYVASGDPKNGILAMQRAVALDQQNPRLHFLLGQLYRKDGQPEKARHEIEISKNLYGSHSTDPNH